MAEYRGQSTIGKSLVQDGTTYYADTAAGNVNNPLNIIRDVKSTVFSLKPWENPLLRMITGAGRKRSVANPKYEMMERRRNTETFTLSADITATDITLVGAPLTFASTAAIRKGDVLHLEDISTGKKEDFVATDIDTDGEVKAYGEGTSGVAANDFTAANTKVTIIGSAQEEGKSDTRNAINLQSEFPYNYCQLFTEPVEISKTEQATAHFDSDNMNTKLAEAAVMFARKLERTFWFGRRSIVASSSFGSKLMRKTGGVFYSIYDDASLSNKAYYYDVGTESANAGVLTEARFDDFLERAFDEGSSKKTLYAHSMLIAAINKWTKNKLRVEMRENEYGVSVYKYVSPFGMVDVIYNKHFNKIYGNSFGIGALLDMDSFGFCYLNGNGINRDISVEKDINARGADGFKHQYIAEVGLEAVLPENNSIITGVASYS